MARSLYHPSYVYLSQDVAGPWKSIDSGETWVKTLDNGLFVNNGESIEVDPADEQTVFVIEHGNWLNENASGAVPVNGWRRLVEPCPPEGHEL